MYLFDTSKRKRKDKKLIGDFKQGYKKPLLMGKKEGKNNIKIMKKIRLYFFSMPQHQKLMQR